MNRTVYQPMRGCNSSCCYSRAPVDRPDSAVPGCAGSPVQEEVRNMPLAMAYVKIQTLGEMYDPCTALIAGTLFPALDMPFCGETVSASAYPNPPARTCDCALPTARGRCSGCQRGGDLHD